MTTPEQRTPRVLLVEDEHIVASALSRGLRVCGAEVIGPAATVEKALALIESTPTIDGALVDINLRGIQAYAVVDSLIAKQVPTVLATGYETSVVPNRYRSLVVLQKPFDPADAMTALGLS
ncbi:MAG TPA: response regulator [Gemmatimonadaceae bacterium]|jgi:CheY-like chemotaxis protein|nr:response regulator [Gemmatimonadaceae bacterium]